jgi:hypothetical protein
VVSTTTAPTSPQFTQTREAAQIAREEVQVGKVLAHDEAYAGEILHSHP